MSADLQNLQAITKLNIPKPTPVCPNDPRIIPAVEVISNQIVNVILSSPTVGAVSDYLNKEGVFLSNDLIETVHILGAVGTIPPQILKDEVYRYLEEAARAATSVTSFTRRMDIEWGDIRDEWGDVFNAIKNIEQAAGRWPYGPDNNLARYVDKLQTDKVAACMDPAQGIALKQLGKDNAANKNGAFVQIARKIARDLAVNGPITIDDVTEDMGVKYPVLPVTNGKTNNWKGSVFDGSEWTKIGTTPSRIVTAHGRQITLWALKSWIQNNNLNGRGGVKSAFDTARIWRDFRASNPGADIKRVYWVIGGMSLSDDIANAIRVTGNTLYGVKVILDPAAVGAILFNP